MGQRLTRAEFRIAIEVVNKREKGGNGWLRV